MTKGKVTTTMSLKVKLLQDEDDNFLLSFEGEAIYAATAIQGLLAVVPKDAISAKSGMILVRRYACDFLDAWLAAVKISHRASITWLPIAANV